MKKVTLTVVTLALVGLLAAGAWAAGPYGGGYGPRGYCYGPQAGGTVDREAAAKFSTETLELRKQIAAKRVEMQTLLAQPAPDQAKVKALGDEIVELQAQVAKKANQAGLASGYGRGNGQGYGRGYGRGQGRGYGRGGYGPGYGACWR